MNINKYPNWNHFEERTNGKINHLVVHSFAFSVNKMIDIFNELKVSPHYLIDIDGTIIQFVEESKLAYHAGQSYWKGTESLNETSIGIELQNMSLGQTPYSEKQLYSFRQLATKIINKYNIQPYNVVGHSDIAPTRKVDPGKCFPWKDMAKHGIGLWTSETMESKNIDIKTLLQQIGYDVSNERAALYAFMRRFMPDEILTNQDIYKMEKNLLHDINNYKINPDVILGRLNAVANLFKTA